jgi:hypothetical protein
VKTEFHMRKFFAFGTAGALCVLGWSLETNINSSVATKTDRLPVTVASADGYVTGQSPVPSGSLLCKLPIRINSRNDGRPPRCN